MPGKNGATGRFRVWPGIVVPVGLTLLLGISAWLFAAKVDADQERADREALRLESYARLEAGDIAALAKTAASEFVESRLAARRNQEKNMRLETKGVLDSVYRMLAAGLDKARKSAAARREVGPFPPGFDGVRSFLEISPSGDKADEALAALRATLPELSALLPSGCSLAVIEDNSRELVSVGGGVPPEGALSTALTRDFLFNDGNAARQWSLRVELVASDAAPPPGATETAMHIAERLGDRRLENATWRGWLLGPGGEVVTTFPVPPADAAGQRPQADDRPPFVNSPGKWVEMENNRLAWLERSQRIEGCAWTPAAAVAIERPAPPLDLLTEFRNDTRWSLTLIALAVFSLVGWAWFVRLLLASKRDAVPAPAPASAAPIDTRQAKQRLVRAAGAARAVPEVQGVIVADIDDDGSVRVGELPPTLPRAKPKPPAPAPSGSLFRLQAIHRGREGGQGSRILDQARSQVLKELASRVRPGVNAEGGAAARPAAVWSKGGEKITSMKSPSGWKKVEE